MWYVVSSRVGFGDGRLFFEPSSPALVHLAQPKPGKGRASLDTNSNQGEESSAPFNSKAEQTLDNGTRDVLIFKRVLERMAADSTVGPEQLVAIGEALAALDSRRSDNNAGNDKALLRAVSLAMRTHVDDTVLAVAAQKAGEDFKANVALIKQCLYRATLAIAWHGDDENGARYAKTLICQMAKAALKYQERENATLKEQLISAIRSLGHARLINGKSKLFPNYNAIARAVLHSKLGDRDFEQQVAKLEKILPDKFAPYICDTGYRRDVDLNEIARVALKAGGIDPYRILESPKKMRETRLKAKLGDQPAPKRRGARTPNAARTRKS